MRARAAAAGGAVVSRWLQAATFAIAAGCSGCGAPVAQDPDLLVLGPELHEISGIVALGDEAVCVQDEVGVLFTIGLADGRVRARRAFGRPGDYEGIAHAGDSWFVLRSDGVLIELRPDGDRLREQQSVKLPWPHAEWESVAHDPEGNRLVLAPKSLDVKGKEARDLRPLYAFDLATRTAAAKPFLTLSVARIAEQAAKLGFEVPIKTTARGKERLDLQLLWSDIAVSPTGDFALVAAVDHAVLIVDRKGDVRSLRFLNEKTLPQPEGLSFLPDGRLLVASEGVTGNAAIRTLRADAKAAGDGKVQPADGKPADGKK
jgi:hypothetical protein